MDIREALKLWGLLQEDKSRGFAESIVFLMKER